DPALGRFADDLAGFLVLVSQGHFDPRTGRRLERRIELDRRALLRAGHDQSRVDLARVGLGAQDRLDLLGLLTTEKTLKAIIPLAQTDGGIDDHAALLAIVFNPDARAELDTLDVAGRRFIAFRCGGLFRRP